MSVSAPLGFTPPGLCEAMHQYPEIGCSLISVLLQYSGVRDRKALHLDHARCLFHQLLN